LRARVRGKIVAVDPGNRAERAVVGVGAVIISGHG
jgi:hypothetical protein